MTGGSLRGQNKDRRIAGVGSSPTLPTKSARTRLWKRLRKLDRDINSLDHLTVYQFCQDELNKTLTRIEKLDAKRKQVRLKLKGYDV